MIFNNENTRRLRSAFEITLAPTSYFRKVLKCKFIKRMEVEKGLLLDLIQSTTNIILFITYVYHKHKNIYPLVLLILPLSI
jgi:hypothetical protein